VTFDLSKPTGFLALAGGTTLKGIGLGATGHKVGEVCFNTSITGYQEILTDPSYAGQIITFTFPHIGNMGTNPQDVETLGLGGGNRAPAVRGAILRADVTNPANYRAAEHLDAWLKAQNIIAITGIDTRALTKLIREKGMLSAVIAHLPGGAPDLGALGAEAEAWPGLEGMDLAIEVTCKNTQSWDQTRWDWKDGFGTLDKPKHKVVAMDFGIKANILRCLASQGCDVTVVPATAKADDILALNPDGIFLSNGPGDPAATGAYAVPEIKQLIDSGKVEIVSMNHGFTVDRHTLPKGVSETHVSLFDDSNCGIEVTGKPIFGVQYHPEASPGPQDSH
jgi:carbamoyl-phosphate synthase small subunit